MKELPPKDPHQTEFQSLLLFHNAEKRGIISQCLNTYFAAGNKFAKKSIDEDGRQVSRLVSPQVVVDESKDMPVKTVARLYFDSLSNAEIFYTQHRKGSQLTRELGVQVFVNSEKQVRVKYAYLYPDLDEVMANLAATHGVSIKRRHKDANFECVDITRGGPKNIAVAAAALKAMTMSIPLLWNTDKQRSFNTEFDDFEDRYIVIPLIATVNNLAVFKRHGGGSKVSRAGKCLGG